MLLPEWHSEYEYTVTPGRMVRGPRYKYTHYLEGNGEELYDMKNDPGERKNLCQESQICQGSCRTSCHARRLHHPVKR